MSREAWLIKELSKLPDIIYEAEQEAEREWLKENGIELPKRSSNPVGTIGRTEHKCINCHSPFWTTSVVGIFWPDEKIDNQLKEALSGQWSDHSQAAEDKQRIVELEVVAEKIREDNAKLKAALEKTKPIGRIVDKICNRCLAYCPNWEGAWHDCYSK